MPEPTGAHPSTKAHAGSAASSTATSPFATTPFATTSPAAGPTPVGLPDLAAVAASSAGSGAIGILDDVTLQVRIELGRTRMLVEDVLRLNSDSVVELDKAAGDPVDIFVNGRRIARGEVLVLNDNFCVRVSEILSTEE